MEPTRGRAKGRGRARGRARGASPAVGASAQQDQPVGAVGLPPQTQRAQYRGAADRPGLFQQAQLDVLEQQFSGVKIGDNVKTGSSGGNGSGNGRPVTTPAGRGVTRGRRDISNVQLMTTRPATLTSKIGNMGQIVKVLVNYFKVAKKDDWHLCLYHVDFNPDEDRTGTRKKLLKQHAEALGANYIFDGMQLYMARHLGQVTEFVSRNPDTKEPYQVKITFIKELSPLDAQYLQIMNIILRRCQDYLGLTLVGRNYYNANAEIKMPQYNIKIWPGFQTSIRQFERSILLNADVSHKFMRNDSVYHILRNMGGNVKRNSEKLLGSVVMTKYNDKTYRLDDIDWNMNPQSKFETKNGEISYIDYYLTRYNIKLTDPRQPMLLSKPKQRDRRRGMVGNIYLVPELCIMTGIPEELLGDFSKMKELATYLRVVPDKRVQTLLKFSHDMRSHPKVSTELNQWGLKLDSNLMTIQGRILPEETLNQGGRPFSYDRMKSDWSREMRDKSLNTPINIENWSCIAPQRCAEDAKALVQTLCKVGQPMGMYIQRPNFIILRGDSAQEYIHELNNCVGQQIVLAILPNNRGDRYGGIKKHLSVNLGIPSQCVVSKTLFKKNRLMSVGTKVAIQMNCKLGGDVWNLNIPLKNCMVIGYDAYHDSLKKGSSYGAVVSSYNQQWTKYFGQVAEHKNHEELSNNFSMAVRTSLQYYVRVNNVAPSTVIVFRDGVGEGQLEYVKEHEIQEIRRSFDEVIGGQPKFAFVVVSKRINTRIMSQQGNFVTNPVPGTVVDDEITLPERYDFFLVSQAAGQGTVSPTSYNVIEDTSGLKPDHIQRLAYKLTHLYYNWQGTVRVPAPCLYAHKLAFITGQSIHSVANANLNNKLWYL